MQYDNRIINRLKRIEGQVRGVINMMEAGEGCHDVATQMTAIRAAVDRTIGVIVSENLERCVRNSLETGGNTDTLVKEAVDLLVKSR